MNWKRILLSGSIVIIILMVSISVSRLRVNVRLPDRVVASETRPVIWPDYSSTTLPPNIAPTNFEIRSPGIEFITAISSVRGKPILVPGRTVKIDPVRWKNLLADNAGEELRFEIYAFDGTNWSKTEPIINRISKDPIDPYVSYRLIEPGYEFFRSITLNQRSLESFDTKVFANNELVGTSTCFNCHSWQNRQTQRYLFHTRNNRPGTVLVDKGNVRKLDLKPGGLFSSCAYPAWHPTLNLIAFSINKTFQSFHSLDRNRIEVIDERSDLAIFDVEKNEIVMLLRTENDFETFPSWSQDGRRLYYCCASVALPPAQKGDLTDSQAYKSSSQTEEENDETPRKQYIRKNRHDFKYNLMSMSFDPETRTFGQPELVVDAAKIGKSIAHPRISPDGRYLIYTQADYGTFPIWHPESDLYLLDLESGKTRPLNEVNSDDTESYHTWDSTGRWFVFSSRRDDGSYTRLYFAHFNEDGTADKPFILPQKDPRHHDKLFRSFNLPEMMSAPVGESLLQLMKGASKDPGEMPQLVFPGQESETKNDKTP